MMEWENQHHSQPPQPQATFVDGGDVVNAAGAMYVKVMTDEQMEVLRTQIAVYATISEQLVEMHKAVTAQQDLAGVRLGNPYCDPLVTSIGHKITARQRWTPTPIQLQILESIFDQGTGTPSKQKIKEITSELSQHGQISETNVYNWFQNRRARSKRKQLNATSNNGETETETDAESPKDKKSKPGILQQSQQGLEETTSSSYLQSHHHEIVGSGGGMDLMCAGSGESGKVEPHVFQSDGNDLGSRSTATTMGQLSFIESMLETPRLDQLIGKMEVPGNYDPYHSGEDYSMTG